MGRAPCIRCSGVDPVAQDRPVRTLDVDVLGPLRVVVDGAAVDVPGLKQRGVLARLALEPDRGVAVGDIVFAVWGDDSGHRAEHTLQQHVSGLRKLLEPSRDRGAAPVVLLTEPPGYRLRVTRLDAHEFEEAVAEGRALAAAGERAAAVTAFNRGLARWRGPALADLRENRWFDAVAAGHEERRLAALEDRNDVLLDAGRHAELIADVAALAETHPFRERFRGQLMLALYRAGRQADALAAYQQARTVLVDELGIEPSQQLRQLERAILEQSPTLFDGATDLDDLHATHKTGDEADTAWIQLPDGQLVTLTEGTNLIGRAPEARVRLQDSRVSRRHAAIEVAGGGHQLVDLGSANGTAVDGNPVVSAHQLVDGEAISVGGVPLVFRAGLDGRS